MINKIRFTKIVEQNNNDAYLTWCLLKFLFINSFHRVQYMAVSHHLDLFIGLYFNDKGIKTSLLLKKRRSYRHDRLFYEEFGYYKYMQPHIFHLHASFQIGCSI